MTASNSQTMISSPAAREQALPNVPTGVAAPWPVFRVASVAVLLVSMDRTMSFPA